MTQKFVISSEVATITVFTFGGDERADDTGQTQTVSIASTDDKPVRCVRTETADHERTVIDRVAGNHPALRRDINPKAVRRKWRFGADIEIRNE